MQFELLATAAGSAARRGRVHTLHGAIETPVFMPVGTRGTVRTQSLAQLHALDPSIILANTYHLLLGPGPEVLTSFGGLHNWMKWDRAILTDSGGFQIFSLASARTMTEAGAEFKSRYDGRKFLLSPEASIAMQRAIGSDIMMVLDQCIPSTSDRAATLAALELTTRWAKRSLAARDGSPAALFAIAQGACFPDLRKQSVDALLSLPDVAGRNFDGFAIGGLAVGETKREREDMCELTAQLLPSHKPRYLMGVGTPLDLLEGVHRGVDMFDCVLPTAWAQQGEVFTSKGRLSLRRGVYKFATDPLDPACPCDACRLYSRSYLHHLVKNKEPLGWQLLSYHNLRFYLNLMSDIRTSITDATFGAFYQHMRERLASGDVDNPPAPAPRSKSLPARGAFRVVQHQTPSGETVASVQHVASGEVMHSVSDPNVEAHALYIAQSAWLAKLRADVEPAPQSPPSSPLQSPLPSPLIVWDVGLGAGHNAMALLQWLQACPGHPPVVLHSFEKDLDALRLAASNLKLFPHLRSDAPHRLLKAADARGAAPGQSRADSVAVPAATVERSHGTADTNFTWHLHVSDIQLLLGQPSVCLAAPHVIFWDPFSAKVDTPLWSYDAFAALATHASATHATELFTYSNSTAVRSALLAAGFWVGVGTGTGPKAETTRAWLLPTPDHGQVLASSMPLLDHAWLAKRSRSTAKLQHLGDHDPVVLEAAVVSHPQFFLPKTGPF